MATGKTSRSPKKLVGTCEVATVKSARRVLEVFEFFAQRRGAASIGEIAKALGYPQSSTSMIMKSLHDLKYMHYDSARWLYWPTLRLALISSWLSEQRFTGAELTALMTELRDRTGGTIVLGIRNDVQAQYIQVIAANMPAQFVMKIGQLRPLCHTAVGKIILAHEEDETVTRLVHRINASTELAQRVQIKALMEELEQVRRVGFSYSESSVIPGAAAVAVPLPATETYLPMALGVGGPAEHIRAHRGHIERCLHDVLGAPSFK